jgi:hypothetical protein
MPDVYEKMWIPQDYLGEYYSGDYVTDDERAIFKFILEHLSKGQIIDRAIDFGSGCTLHHAMSLIPYVKELHLADYLQSNLDQVQTWLDNRSDSHNWDVYFRGVLALEKDLNVDDISITDLDRRKQELRTKITNLKLGNIYNSHPLSDASTYDLVASFYCAESITSTKDEWKNAIVNLFKLVAPGGTLLISALRNCHSYRVIDTKFSVAPVDETDLEAILLEHNFDPDSIEIRPVAVADSTDSGFDGICLVKAVKLPTLGFYG